MHDRELDDFVAYSDAKIPAIAAFLDEQGETADIVIVEGEEDVTLGDDDASQDLPSPCHQCATDN
jgi:hypothetical protein